jgi:secreted PhoX family phosphatase
MTKNRIIRTTVALALTVLTAVPAVAAGPNASPRTYSDQLIADPNQLLSLPDGFQYSEVVNWNNWVQWGLAQGINLSTPDMNVYVPLQQPLANGAVAYLYTNHEVANKMGGVTRIALDASNKMIGEPEIILKGLSRPCAGSLTPWGTILTGEEAEGYVWEIDAVTGATKKINGLGKYNHETGVVDPRTGEVWSTDDSYNPTTGRGNIYKFVPETYGDLSTGTLYALDAANKQWVKIENPENAPAEAVAKGVVPFYRPEDAEFGKDGWAYVSITETDNDGVHHGRVIRINPVNLQIQDFVVGTTDGLNMPDNLVFDGKGNLYIEEDSSGLDEIWVAQPSGHIQRFAATVAGPNVGETTGGFFTPDDKAMFVNLQGKNNRTLVITGF